MLAASSRWSAAASSALTSRTRSAVVSACSCTWRIRSLLGIGSLPSPSPPTALALGNAARHSTVAQPDARPRRHRRLRSVDRCSPTATSPVGYEPLPRRLVRLFRPGPETGAQGQLLGRPQCASAPEGNTFHTKNLSNTACRLANYIDVIPQVGAERQTRV